MTPKKSTMNKKGGNSVLMSDASKLIIPFGLYLAKQSLEKFVNEGTKSKQGKKVALTGPKSKTVSPKPASKGGGDDNNECKQCGSPPLKAAMTKSAMTKSAMTKSAMTKSAMTKSTMKGGSNGLKNGIEGYTTKDYASATGGTKRTKKI
jgi:hypothetical protein